MSTSRAIAGSLLLLVSIFAPAVGAEPASSSHPFGIHDMLAMQRVGDPQGSPDGAHVAFTLRTTDLPADRGRTDLWLVPTAGGEPRRLTTHEAADHSPRWAADGKSILFLSTRDGSSQVWRLPLVGGEAQQVTALPLDVTSFAPVADGTTLVVSLEVFPDCPKIQCTVDRLAQRAERRTSAMVYDQLIFRHWDTWKDGRRSHLFSVPVAGGEPIDLMRGMDADCPSKPFGGPEEYTPTPDGKAVVFSARDAGREEAWSTDFDLYVSPFDASTAPRNLTHPNPAWDTNPVFSPDGKTLAWLAMREAGYESDRRRIVLAEWPSGRTRTLTEAWDRSPGSIVWDPDGRTIYAVADHVGQRGLFAVDATTGKARALIDEGTVRGVVPLGDRIVYGLDHLQSPVELYSVDRRGRSTRRLTGINDARVAAARMGEPSQFSFEGWNGETVHAYVVEPADRVEGRRYPVAFLVHGGPQGSFGNDFHYRWNPQAYAGAGYAAVMVDFHGSTGYGQQFTDSIRGDWGGKPLVDLQKGLAAALERHPWMDGERVCALGASYGGYMMNWIAGNWPDRFDCLVNHDGNLDERLAYFDTEELWFPERDHMGTPWDNPEGYEKHNPINHVAKWKTPMLVIHGALDYRVVDTQGMSTFTALQRRGVPSKFVYFPDENHWVLKPHNSIFWHETVLDWLGQWTVPDSN